jgi:hypothetical protein
MKLRIVLMYILETFTFTKEAISTKICFTGAVVWSFHVCASSIYMTRSFNFTFVNIYMKYNHVPKYLIIH